MKTYLAEVEYHDPSDIGVSKLFWSEDFANDAAWVPFRVGLSGIAVNQVANPIDGAVTADMLTLNSGGTRMQKFIAEAGWNYTYSLYVRLGNSSKSLYFGVWNPRANWIAGLYPGDPQLDGLNTSSFVRLTVTFSVVDRQEVWLLLPWASGVNTGKTLYAFGAMINTGTSAHTYQKTEAAPTRILRVSTLEYTTKPADNPSSVPVPGCLIQPGLMRRDLFSNGKAGGEVTPSYGLVEIAHAGELDFLGGLHVDGRSYTLKIGDTGSAFSTFTTVLVATIEQIAIQRTKVTIKLKDKLKLLDTPVSKNTYAGSNGSGSYLDGDISLADRRKPFVFGHAHNISPVLVNEARLIYQTHDGAVGAGSYFDNGVGLSRQSDYASLNDMLNTWPDKGCFRELPSMGLVRLGLAPASGSGSLTAFVSNYDTDLPGDAIKAIAIAAGWPADKINAADVTAVNNAGGANWIGYFVSGNETAMSVMNDIAVGIGIWFGPDALGVLRMGVLQEPSGSPVASFTDDHIKTIERLASDPPVKSVTVKYDRNWTVQQDLFTNIDPSRREWLKTEWRQVTAESLLNAMASPLGESLEVQSALVVRDGADEVAKRLMAMHGTVRERYSVTLTSDQCQAVDLNSVVSIQTGRHGLDNGKLFRVIGIQPDYYVNRIDMTLWG